MILSVCDVPEILEVMSIVKIIITIIKIIVPIILILSLMFDYASATLSSDKDSLSKKGKLTINKAIALVLVFLIPTFVNILTNLVIPNFSYSDCINNATSSGIKVSYEKVMKQYMDEAKSKMDMASYLVARDYLKHIENKELKSKSIKSAKNEKYI